MPPKNFKSAFGYGRVGIHLVMRPAVNSSTIPVTETKKIEKLIQQTSLLCSCKLKAFSAMADHMHVLIEADNEENVINFVPEVLLVAEREIQSQLAKHETFHWRSDVHVTLLPPWHLEILASFVRDQELYHKSHDVDQELREIFQSDSIAR